MSVRKKADRYKIAGILIMSAILLFLSAALLLGKDREYSKSERRALKTFPEITAMSLKSGSFMEEFEEYTLDQFPFREMFRGWKTLFSINILQNKDNNSLYSKEGYLAKMEYPLEEDMIEYGAGKINSIYDRYLKETGSRCYVSVVPDKNYFMAPRYGMLSMDYQRLFSLVRERTSRMEYLDIAPLLSLEDYYKTDTHWKQEKIEKIASFLGQSMGTQVEADYERVTVDIPFYGVYAGQWSLPVQAEEITCLTNDILEGCRVVSLDTGKEEVSYLYDMEKAGGKDPYEMFLSGTRALLVIENPGADTDKELILFRDSFGSSLAPLFIPGYSKITVVDIRYVQSSVLERFIDFHGQDVLFLYSTLILNNSRALR